MKPGKVAITVETVDGGFKASAEITVKAADENPGTPENPGNPGNPENPGIPESPGNPENPVNSGNNNTGSKAGSNPPSTSPAGTLNVTPGTSHTNISLKGEVYEFNLFVTSKDGVTEKLTAFDSPITLSLKPGDGFEAKSGGIYYIADNGKLEYVPAKYISGVLTASISHFSKYAVLELNRTFTDVPANHWANDVIKELAAKLLVQGTNSDKFEPSRAVTRAEFTSMLVQSLGLTATGTTNLTDVAPGAWYAEPIAAAYKVGIVNGRSASTFEPSAKITREEITVMLMKVYELKNDKAQTPAAESGFTDMNLVSDWAALSVNEAAALGLIQGQSQGLFAPKRSLPVRKPLR